LKFYPFFFLSASCLVALPQEPVILAEAVTFASSANKMEITAANGAIINWGDFSIGASEEVHFFQPSNTATVLNRVVSSTPSQIHGLLQANGNVILINPNGIIFGEDAIINTASLVASTFDVLNEPFQTNRKLQFSGASSYGVIDCEGTFTAQGDFVAVGHAVTANAGSVEVSNGDIALFGLGALELSPTGSNVFFHKISDQGLEYSIQSNQALLDTHYQDPNLGSVVLGNNLEAIGGDNPAVYTLGSLIFLTDPSSITARGNVDGGSVFIGGAPANNATFPSKALYTLMSNESSIDVSAENRGHGGNAYLWAEKSTQFYGDISANGGLNRGDGGFIEVSGVEHLEFNGTVHTDAPFGSPGELLIDPTNVTIGLANSNVTLTLGNYNYTGTPAVIGAAALVVALAGTNVTIDTAATVDQGQVGNITVSAPVVWPGARTLNLIANQDILFQATVENTGAGGLNVTAARDVLVDALGATVSVAVGARNAPINVTAGRDLLVRGGVAAGGIARFAVIGTAAPVVNAGAITINVGRNALVQGGTGAVALAAPNSAFALIGGFTNSTRVIQMNVGNDLTIQGGTGGLVNRGAPFAAIGSYIGTNNGNISVRVGHDCLIQGGICAAGVSTHGVCAGIMRYGEGLSVVGTTTMTDFNLDVANNLTMVGGTISNNTQATAIVGYGGFQLNPAAVVNIGNITINVGHNFEMRCGVGSGAADVVGGTQRPCQGNVTINVGENMWLHNENPLQTLGFAGATIGGSGIRTPWGLNFFVTVGETLTFDARNGAFTDCHCFNTVATPASLGTVQFHVGGDLVFIGGNKVGVDIATIWLHPNLVNEIWVGGNWRAYNGSPLLSENEAGVEPNSFFNPLGNLGRPDWRAGGNIGIAGASLFSIGSLRTLDQPITIIADYTFAPDQLWAPKTTIVNGNNIFTGTPLGSSSGSTSTVAPFHGGGDGFGAVFVDTNAYDFSTVLFPTTINGPTWSVADPNPPAPPVQVNMFVHKFYNAGTLAPADLLIQSQDIYDNGAPADFAIGTVPGTTQLQSPGGNVTVEGFRDTLISDLSSIVATFGNITIDTVRDLVGSAFSAIAGTNISLTVGQNINFNTGLMQAGIDLMQTAGDDITLVDSSEFALAGNIVSLAGNNSSLTNSAVQAGMNIDWVIDNDFPTSPLIGPSGLRIDSTSSFSVTGYLRLYTARRNQNTISPLAQFISNGIPFSFIPGTIFQNTDQEKWCTYYPDGTLGVPFRLFYKDCLQEVIEQATVVVTEFLVDLHPYGEFPGWMEEFHLAAESSLPIRFSYAPFYLRRRHLNVINQPKTWTDLMPELNWAPIDE